MRGIAGLLLASVPFQVVGILALLLLISLLDVCTPFAVWMVCGEISSLTVYEHI